MNTRRASSGFALLMTLLLVVIAGIALTGIARRSAMAAVHSLGEVEELQRRWAITSCRATLLDRAGAIMDGAERPGRPTAAHQSASTSSGQPASQVAKKIIPSLHLRCQLSGVEYELLLVDEQTKLNINNLWGQHGPTKTRAILRTLLFYSHRSTNSPLDITPQPLRRPPSTTGQSRPIPLFGSYDQMTPGIPASVWMGTEGAGGLASKVTCWGDGKLHFRRSPDAVIEQACGHLIDPTSLRAFLIARRTHPALELEDLLINLEQMPEKIRSILRNTLTERSDCHALWIAVHDAQRSWYTLSVGEGTGVDSDATDPSVQVRTVNRRHDFAW